MARPPVGRYTFPAVHGLTIRPLREGDLDAADRIFRVAFGTFLGLPDPAAFAGDADWVRTRWRADPSRALAAELDGELVGSNLVTCWGSVGFFGPLTVRSDLWNRGVARRLLEATMPLLDAAGVRHAGLFTFADSPKHLGLYQRFGFWPRFLTAVMEAPAEGAPRDHSRWSLLPHGARAPLLAAARSLTEAVHAGLDVTREIESVMTQGIGDIVTVPASAAPDAIAVCHCGAGSEAGSGVCYLKFAAVRPGPAAEKHFDDLLDACAALSRERGLARLVAGVNTARRMAYRRLVARGFRTQILGIAMHRNDDPIYDRPDALVLDDWR